MKAIKVTLFIVFYSSLSVHAGINVGLNLGYAFLSSTEMQDKKVSGRGLSQEFKIGFLLKGNKSEFGFYNGSKNYTAVIDHDDEDGEIASKVSTFGIFYTYYYSKSLFFEFGYGKVEMENSVSGDYTDAQKVAIKNLFELDQEEDIENEIKLLAGLKLFNIGPAIISITGQYSLYQGSSYSENVVGLETKLPF